MIDRGERVFHSHPESTADLAQLDFRPRTCSHKYVSVAPLRSVKMNIEYIMVFFLIV